MAFVDLRKVYDTVLSKQQWNAMIDIEIPQRIMVRVKTDNNHSKAVQNIPATNIEAMEKELRRYGDTNWRQLLLYAKLRK